MLSVKVVDAIIESGNFFDDELDLDKKEVVLTDESRGWFAKNLDVANIDSAFVDFFSLFVGGCGPRAEADPLFTLEEILDSHQNPYWEGEYPGFGKQYLQLSSIEGEGSFFYAKATDKVYSASWGEMNDLSNNRLPEKFDSFHKFLEWYFIVQS